MSNLNLTLFVFYIILLTFVFFPLFYWNQSNMGLRIIERKSILLDWRFWIPALVYSILLGYRWDYAYDWNQYYNTFNCIQHGELYRDTTEKGYLAVNYLLGYLGFSFYSIFILEGFVYILSIFFLLKDNRRTIIFALPLIYMAARFNCLNISRQFFAQSLLWIGFYYLLHEKKICFWVFSMLAFTIHTSAIVWIPIFYLMSYVKKMPNIWIMVSVYFACWIIRSLVQNYFIEGSNLITAYIITNKEYDGIHIMEDKFLRNDYEIGRIILLSVINLGYIFSSYFVFNRFKFKSQIEKLIVFVGIIGICLNVLGGTHEIFNRFFWYFSYLYYVGWGVVLFYLFMNRNMVPWYLWFVNLLGIAQLLWSMYASIVDDVIRNHHFIQYKVF